MFICTMWLFWLYRRKSPQKYRTVALFQAIEADNINKWKQYNKVTLFVFCKSILLVDILLDLYYTEEKSLSQYMDEYYKLD